ncbi:MAG: UDP-glucose/GDP-mannose dehydrogenase family protein [Vulcanimicrobiota bacterium]
MNISIIGTGYVGLVSGVCLASRGHQVACVDIDDSKIQRINNGDPPIHEDGLEELLRQTLGNNNLKATTQLDKAVHESDVSIIAVGTPFDGQAIDLSVIRQVSRNLGRALASKTGYHVVAVKSTVVPGTTEEVVLPILEEASGKLAGRDFGVGMNPEFLREGVAVKDFLDPDRVVIGGIDARTQTVLAELYSVFPGVDIVKTTTRTAEMIKYATNSLLATLISFSNELANLSSSVGGIDIADVMKGLHLDRRLNPISSDRSRTSPGILSYLKPGCGFGGSCFPKDVKALIAHGQRVGQPMSILQSVIDTNEKQPLKMLDLLKKHHRDLRDLNVAVLGLAFKPGTDDIRESPAIPILRELLGGGAKVKAFDPVAAPAMEELFSGESMSYHSQLDETIDGVQAVLVVTSWPEFSDLPLRLSADTLLIDGRGIFEKASVRRYEGIGIA